MKRLMSFGAVAVGLVAAVAVLPQCSSTPVTHSDGGTPADSGMMPTDGGSMNTDGGGSPDGGGPGDGGMTGPVAQTTALLNTVAGALRSFHKDTGGWPLGGSVWYGDTPPWAPASASDKYGLLVDPGQFTMNDTAMFAQASDPATMAKLQACGSEVSQPCWKGPYLTMPSGASAMADVKDAWGNALFFAYMLPNGNPDSSQFAPNGAIIIWSAGPDGVDQTGCTQGNCQISYDNLAQGMASGVPSDDIIMIIAMNSTSTM